MATDGSAEQPYDAAPTIAARSPVPQAGGGSAGGSAEGGGAAGSGAAGSGAAGSGAAGSGAAGSGAAGSGDLTQELLTSDWWTDAMVAAAGIPVVDMPFVTVGGGIGSFVTVDYLRIAGIPTDRMRVLSDIDF